MSSRATVNSDFAYYIDGDSLIIVYKDDSSGKYETWGGDTVQDGVRIHFTSKYNAVTYYDNNLIDENKVDSGLHAALLDYVKSRIEEDNGNPDKSAYFQQKYRNKVRTYPHRKSGRRGIKVENL